LGVLQIGLKRFRDGTPQQGWYKLGSKAQWEALKLSVNKAATVTKPASYTDAAKEEKSPGWFCCSAYTASTNNNV
jgi:hypothetical protein